MNSTQVVELKEPILVLSLKPAGYALSRLDEGKHQLQRVIHGSEEWWVEQKGERVRGVSMMRWKRHVADGKVVLMQNGRGRSEQ